MPRHDGLYEQKESAAFRAQQLSAVPSDLLTLKNLVRIDLSMNQLTRFPGQLVAAEMLRLEMLLLQGNLLYVIEDVFALSSAPRLREIDLRHNPLRLQNNRLYLLEALLGQPGTGDDLLFTTRKDEQLRLHSGSGGSTSALSRRQAEAMTYRKKLPRTHGFPVLMRLNDEWITDREIRDVEAERGRAIEYYRPPVRASSQGASATRARTSSLKPKIRPASAAPDPVAADHTGRRFDGSRLTVKQMLRNESRSASIPIARVIQRFQIDADTGDEVEGFGENDETRDNEPSLRWIPDADCESRTRSSLMDPAPTLESGADDSDGALEGKAEEQMIIRRLFQKASAARELAPEHRNLSSESLDGPDPVDTSAADGEKEPTEPWNYPISTFDTLGSEERQYVRAKSKQSGSTLERDDHFFSSSVFLDCVAQAERSRRLTVRAVDLLSQQQIRTEAECSAPLTRWNGTQSEPNLPTCAAAATLVAAMNAKFTRQLDRATYEKVRAFQEKQLSVDALNIQAVVGDYYLSEHMLQKQRTNQVLSAAQAAERALHPRQYRERSQAERGSAASAAAAETAVDAEANIEDSLSKLKLRNAVDLANTLQDPKQQKRMLQQLIDADDKVIEEERVAQEQTAHKLRLELIDARRYTPHDAKQIDELVRKANSMSASPWQRRNWTAVKAQQQQRELAERLQSSAIGLEPTGRTKSTASTKMPSANEATAFSPELSITTGSSSSGSEAPRFRSIETVERAALDSLAAVNSHDLLVRCSEIRQHAGKHAAELAQYRDRFLDDEAAWEHMRQDPTNLVRKHLARRLNQHAQEVQIGSTQLFYSSLFNST